MIPPEICCSDCAPFRADGKEGAFMFSGGTRICLRCGEPLLAKDDGSEFCLACLLLPFPAHEIRSLGRYCARLERAIKALKYGSSRRLASYFAGLMAQAVLEDRAFSDPSWDSLVALPSSPDATGRRGFSHITLIALKLAGHLGLRFDRLALRSRARRPSQTRLALPDRFANVAQAFSPVRNCVEGRRLLLIDDVLTTGASVSAAAHALLAGGATAVDVLTLARSQQFFSLRLRAAFVVGEHRL